MPLKTPELAPAQNIAVENLRLQGIVGIRKVISFEDECSWLIVREGVIATVDESMQRKLLRPSPQHPQQPSQRAQTDSKSHQ